MIQLVYCDWKNAMFVIFLGGGGVCIKQISTRVHYVT